MRFLKPLLAAAAVLTIAAPAASALADPYWGGNDPGYHRAYDGDGDGYRHDGDGDGYRRHHDEDGGYWRFREAQREEAWRREQAWRVHQYWAHRRWEERHQGWGY